MNWKRVILCGALAGVVMIVGELVTAALLRDQYIAAMRMLGRTATMAPGGVATSLLITLGVGIFAVWLYAAIRPRFGPGPKTAVIAGFATWLLQGSSNLRFASEGLIPWSLLGYSGPIALVEFIVATLIGAWLYRESAP